MRLKLKLKLIKQRERVEGRALQRSTPDMFCIFDSLVWGIQNLFPTSEETLKHYLKISSFDIIIIVFETNSF